MTYEIKSTLPNRCKSCGHSDYLEGYGLQCCHPDPFPDFDELKGKDRIDCESWDKKD